jgi:hypothetical protein
VTLPLPRPNQMSFRIAVLPLLSGLLFYLNCSWNIQPFSIFFRIISGSRMLVTKSRYHAGRRLNFLSGETHCCNERCCDQEGVLDLSSRTAAEL